MANSTFLRHRESGTPDTQQGAGHQCITTASAAVRIGPAAFSALSLFALSPQQPLASQNAIVDQILRHGPT